MYAFLEAFVQMKKASSMSKINSVAKWVHHFNHVREELKRDVKKNLSYLQKDRFAFVRELFDRIEEIRYIQKRLWKIVEDNPDKPIYKKVVYLNSINQQ
jgi:hypothetical protein